MSAMIVRLPDSLVERIEAAARQDGVSVDQFVASAAAEKLAAWMTVDYLKQEAAQGQRADFESYLKAVPAAVPLPGDELPGHD